MQHPQACGTPTPRASTVEPVFNHSGCRPEAFESPGVQVPPHTNGVRVAHRLLFDCASILLLLPPSSCCPKLFFLKRCTGGTRPQGHAHETGCASLQACSTPALNTCICEATASQCESPLARSSSGTACTRAAAPAALLGVGLKNCYSGKQGLGLLSPIWDGEHSILREAFSSEVSLVNSARSTSWFDRV